MYFIADYLGSMLFTPDIDQNIVPVHAFVS